MGCPQAPFIKYWVPLAGGDCAAFKSQYLVHAVAQIDLEEAKTQQTETIDISFFENPSVFV